MAKPEDKPAWREGQDFPTYQRTMAKHEDKPAWREGQDFPTLKDKNFALDAPLQAHTHLSYL